MQIALGRAVHTSRRIRRLRNRAVSLGGYFATRGYGDIIMSPRWRLLGPLETANGILMLGVSIAVMTAAAMDVIKHNMDRLQQREQP